MNSQQFIKKAIKEGIEKIQIIEKIEKEIEYSELNGKQLNYQIDNHLNYRIQAQYKGKTIKNNTEYLEESMIQELKKDALLVDLIQSDSYLEDPTNNQELEPLSLTIEEEINQIKKVSDQIKKNSLLESLEINYSGYTINRRIINHNGVNQVTNSQRYMLYIECVVKEKDQKRNKSIIKSTSKKDSYCFKQEVQTLIDNTINSLKEEPIKSGLYDIIIDPSALSVLLKDMVPLFSYDQINRQGTALMDKLDTKICSEKISIVEDPTNKDYAGYELFDDEGTPTKKKVLIEKGVLKNYLYSTSMALKNNTEPTGNNFGGINTVNMIIEPGTLEEEEMIHKLKDGLYIETFKGVPGSRLQIPTGRISAQVSGFIVRNGKKESGFKNCIITTDIFELFHQVKEVGSNLTFYNTNCGTPSILFEKINIVSD